MQTASSIIASSLLCPSCRSPVEVNSRHVAVAGGVVRLFCSDRCREGVPVAVDPTAVAKRDRSWLNAIGIAIGAGLLVGNSNIPETGAIDGDPAAIVPIAVEAPAVAPDHEVANDREPVFEATWQAELMKDAWFHPLAGPERAMPHNHNQAFGAERAGDRPVECFSGHCGVDLGSGRWGEPVRAAHAGVVARVNRGPNEDRGGIYVKLSHRGGTVFTQYFHLAAVPRWIVDGTHVEAGQVIGLLGDTGVKRSAPHLHFAISVRPSPSSAERYLDPEPLIAIWPLWIPDESRASISAPGLPARKPSRRKPAPAAEPVSTPE